MNPLDLVSADRLDVFARTEFALRRVQGQSDNWTRTLYRAFLAANQVDGSELENGSKASVRDYLQSFEWVIDSIEERGFQPEFGAIPVRDGRLVNGAHRVAAALVTNQQVFTAASDETAASYDYRWMRRRGLSPLFIDAMAMNLLRMSVRARATVLFGESDSVADLVEKELRATSDVIVRKKLALTEIGKRRIVDLTYGHNEWWESSLIEKMTAERFNDGPSQCHIIFTLENNLDNLQQRKEALRTILPQNHFGRRLHGSDHFFDTIFLAEVALNENSRIFLNSASLGNERRIFDLLGGAIRQHRPQLAHQEWCIDGSAVLEMFGLREAKDIDYLASSDDVLPPSLIRVGQNHIEEYNYGHADPFEIISDPRNHLIYKGFKFISLRAHMSNKFGWPDAKSVKDVQLIASASSEDQALYRSLEMQISGSVSRFAYRVIALSDRLLRRLPPRAERLLRQKIAQLRRRLRR